jgi:hypothetical protein
MRAGPPSLPLRLRGPIVVLATLALLGTGIALVAGAVVAGAITAVALLPASAPWLHLR